jgi:hypothetical protein
MENRSKAFAEASPPIDDIMSGPSAANTNPATEGLPADAVSACQDDWAILRRSSVNGLIIGAPQLTAAALAGIGRSLRRPVVWWDSSQTAEPPEVTAGTLVIRDVDRLDVRQQERLSEWMSVQRPGVQVLALARTPLFAQVIDGRFSSDLYYRLNTVLVEVRAQADLPSP